MTKYSLQHVPRGRLFLFFLVLLCTGAINAQTTKQRLARGRGQNIITVSVEETGNQIQMEMQSYKREICAVNQAEFLI